MSNLTCENDIFYYSIDYKLNFIRETLGTSSYIQKTDFLILTPIF